MRTGVGSGLRGRKKREGKTKKMGGGGREKANYSGAGEGVTNRVPSVPFSSELKSCRSDKSCGRTSTVTLFVTQVTNRS